MLILLVVVSLPGTAVGETTIDPPAHASAAAPGGHRRGIVTLTSNLRTSPSMQSEVLTVAQEGMQVDILAETERWYRVRGDDGVEAWIYKSLVSVARVPRKYPRPTPTDLAQPGVTESPALSPANAEVLAVSSTESPAEPQGSGPTLQAPVEERHRLPEMARLHWLLDSIRLHAQGAGAYVVIALGVVLALSMALHLRASRQLRQAMQEMVQIFDLVREIYVNGGIARSGNSDTMVARRPRDSAPQVAIPLATEFSAIEQEVLDALSDQREVQETELAKALAEKGFPGTLVKGVIGDIVRKTGASGEPWVEVRYVHGRYSYQLRSHDGLRLKKR